MDLLVEALLNACMPESHCHKAEDSGTLRLAASISPLLRHQFLDSLSASLKAFVTPGQISTTVDCVLRYVRGQLEVIDVSTLKSEDASGKPQKKKRKVNSASPSPNAGELQKAAVSISLMSRIASTVLSSLPTRYLQEDTQRAVTEAVQDFYAFMRSTLKDTLKKLKRSDNETSLALQWSASSILQLQYTISATVSLQVSTRGDEKVISKLLAALSSSSLIPELQVEIVSACLVPTIRLTEYMRIDPAAYIAKQGRSRLLRAVARLRRAAKPTRRSSGC
jgi:hypothetical protein